MVNPRFIAKIESDIPAPKLAVMIDADNASPKNIEALLAEVAGFGEATIKRIYGDFTSPRSSSWKQVLNKYAITPVQQFAYTTGKNATDSKLIIDAMDLLHTGNIDGFCLVSSDSDFTGLANRIREEGMVVYGFGEKKTPDSFRNACVKFVFTENLESPPDSSESKTSNISKKDASSPAPHHPVNNSNKIVEPVPLELLREACDKNSDDTGWTHLGALGSYVNKVKPDFDPRSFGHKKLKDLFLKISDTFEIEERESPNSDAKNIYVRSRQS